ncbi:hypothetical protein AWH56_018510 [Anaerobacillus isosaccharinicus]|uniref:Uncharacterized protein n=1 Tax=Anaerobacillus isosaccharinicus TaxID=1532552 RepID=A0A1S2LKD9_9BACI|nr:hypothetical protein [Anaerobacillus isosaccharinicus]MBA5587102.1 hypothetical protein [Anaerobacillus isosaccharinicus]QOY34702.1 hypothetical protein AWH56_018510 [Anaerobacillus isosaccharinicus]
MKKSGRWSLKRIGKDFYLYSYQYKPLHLRKRREKNKRFIWKYEGKFGTKKADNFINTMEGEEQLNIHAEYISRKNELSEIIEIAKKLELQHPYCDQRNRIYQISDLKQQHLLLQKFARKMLSIAKGIIDRKHQEKDEENNA